MLRATVLLIGLISLPLQATIVARHDLYQDGPLPGAKVRSWNLAHQERPGGATASGRHLWCNADWKAKPWGGLRVTGGPDLTLTREWIDHGFVRFLLNATVDRYGHPAGDLKLQVRLEGTDLEFVRFPSRFIDRGRGRDEDEASWQEVLVPLSLWRNLQPGDTTSGIAIQTVHQATLAFGIDEVGFVRFTGLPDWYAAMRDGATAQPWVEWPAYDDLPDLLKADRHPPVVRDGRIVRPDGSRVFLLAPYTREDQGVDLQEQSTWELYDPLAHGWIYRELLTMKGLSRLGFNSLSVTMPPTPWWKRCGYDKRDYRDPSLLPATRDRAAVPFYVDTVCWPYTLGAPAERGVIDPAAITQGRNHWTPYRIIGKGRDTWLDMWRTYAARYARHDVPVTMFELFNEPSYVGHSSDHHDEFAGWLEKRHGSLAALNRAWRSEFADWTTAARPSSEGTPRCAGQGFDYDEYLAERFADLVRDGSTVVGEYLPGTLTGVQPMGGYVRRPREAVWKHKIIPHETVVLTPTGGGTWTPGGGDREAPPRALDAGIAPAPFENDLLLALAGDKMIVDNETYSRGTTAGEIHDLLWQHVVLGLDGITTFSWAKRGWAWQKDRENVIDEAENFPYSMLNPAARPTASLRGIHDFAAGIQPISDLILPKPWGPNPQIALVQSWSNARHRVARPEVPDKTETYHQALRYSHWNMTLLPADRILREGAITGYPVVVMAGITHVEPGLVPILDTFVRRGGILVIGESLFDRDLYDQPVTHNLPGIRRGDPRGALVIKRIPGAEKMLPGPITVPAGTPELHPMESLGTLVADEAGAPVVTRRNLGNGRVYYQSADLAGYPLAKILAGILVNAANPGRNRLFDWRLADLRDPSGGLATNILLSRRSHPDRGHHAMLLVNKDRHTKAFTIRVSVGPGPWRVREHITDQDLGSHSAEDLLTNGISLTLAPGRPAVLIIKK